MLFRYFLPLEDAAVLHAGVGSLEVGGIGAAVRGVLAYVPLRLHGEEHTGKKSIGKEGCNRTTY